MLNLGFIGLGVGKRHLEEALRNPNSTCKMACDFSLKNLAEVKSKYPSLSTTTNPHDVLENPEIDLIVVASHDNYHTKQILTGLKNGKHIFAEKPMCLSSEDFNLIENELNKNKDLKLTTNFPLRFTTYFEKIKKSIVNNDFGTIYSMEGDYLYGRFEKITKGWRGDLSNYSTILGGAIHMIDLLLWFSNSRPTEVFAVGSNLASKNTKFQREDFVTAFIKLETDLILKTSANFACIHPHFHSVRIFGTKKTFINTCNSGNYLKKKNGEYKEFKLGETEIDYQSANLLTKFVDSIVLKKPQPISFNDIKLTMSTCFAINQSLAEKKNKFLYE